MSTNAVEKQAQKLNQYLRTQGKKQGKTWRIQVRALLAQTFEALNAKPLNGPLCLELSQKIEAELTALENGESTLTDETEIAQRPAVKQPKAPEYENYSTDETETGAKASKAAMRIGEAESSAENAPCIGEADNGAGEPRIGEAESGAGGQPPQEKKVIPPDEIGLFDLIHIQIRCFFTLNACVRPPYIGNFVNYADKFAENTQARIDRFIGVLSKNEDEFAAKTEVEIGYNDDLLPDMPERGLVLHPKKKKKS